MALVASDAKRAHVVSQAEDRGLGLLTWRSYVPLIVIILMILAVAAVASWNDYRLGRFSPAEFIAYVMTSFFLVFGGFKLMDLNGFAEGYSTYDLLADRNRALNCRGVAPFGLLP